MHLKGAIAGGTSSVAFTLPTVFRPGQAVYVPVDLCNGTNGRLFIQTNGVVSVQPEGGTFSDAQCFTSLDGVNYADTISTPLTLQNGWTNGPFGTRNARVALVGGVVTLSGAIATSGTNSVAFTLPAADRPTTNVFVKVDLCNSHNGRLDIGPSGVVSVETEGGDFAQAQCFTSLDGASFAL